MKLSIGMIVKNEEKYLEQCLTAIKPILENVDSELIVADTGSTDRTVEIAKKFTDNVFYFEWINDFAAARNSTLERAKGEWYMYVDADEIMNGCSDIVDFFNSEEYKKYGSASYIIRSYSDSSNQSLFSDFRERRLSVIGKNIKFVGAVHEILVPEIMPQKELKSVADHFGYVFRDDGVLTELAKEKSERNLQLLKEELARQEASGDLHPVIYCQIADCYDSLKEYSMALESLEKGLSLTPPTSISVILFYVRMLPALWNLGRYNTAQELCNKYFSKENAARTETMLADCYVHFVRADSYGIKRDYKNAIPDIISGFDLYDRYVNGKLITPDRYFVPFSVTPEYIKKFFDNFCLCCTKTNSYDKAAKILRLFPVADFLSDEKYMQKFLKLSIHLMEHFDFSPLKEIYCKLDDVYKQKIIDMLLWRVFKTDKPELVVTGLKTVISSDKKLEDTVEIYRKSFVDNTLTLGDIKEYILKHGTLDSENIWCVMLSANLDITPFITAIDFDPEGCVRAVYKNCDTVIETFGNYDINAISADALGKAAGVYGWAMIGASKNGLDISPLFEKYGMIGARWFNCFSDKGLTVPGDIKAALIVNIVVSAKKEGDFESCIAMLNNLIKLVPAFEPIILDYKNKLQQDMYINTAASEFEYEMMAEEHKQNIRDMIDDGELEEAQALIEEFEKHLPNDPELDELKMLAGFAPEPKSEFEMLAQQVKHNIKALIASEEFDQAQELLIEYEQLCPNDPEIDELKKRI